MGSKFKNNSILRYFLIFAIAFVVSIPLCELPIHFFSSKGMGPQSWEQQWEDRWIIVENAFFFATCICIFCIIDDEEPFGEKLKRKKRKTESKKDE